MRSTACWPASTEHAPARRGARLRRAPGAVAAVLATLGWLHGAAADPPATAIPAVAPAAGVAATGVQGLQALDRMLDGAASAPATPEAPATAVFQVAPEIGLAAFLRGGSLWLVFAGNAPIDGADLATAAARAFGEGRLAPSSDGVALRVALRHGAWPEIRRDGADWIVGLTDRPSAPETPLEVRAEPDFLLGARLLVAQPGARHVVRFEDPGVGDTLYAAPLTVPGRAVADTHELIDVALPATLQGVLVQPFSADLRVRATVGGIEVGRAGGLTLSPTAEPEPAEVVLVPNADDRLFAVAEWRGSAPFLEDRQRHAEAVSVADGMALARRRLDFARFYFAHAYGAEAGALLRLIEEGSAEAADHPEFRALRGAVRVVNRDPEAALADLDDARLRNQPETALCRQ